jgi:hypothetical protein
MEKLHAAEVDTFLSVPDMSRTYFISVKEKIFKKVKVKLLCRRIVVFHDSVHCSDF